MAITNALGIFSDLQKFPCISSPETTKQKNPLPGSQEINDVTTTLQISTEITFFGARKVTIKKEKVKQCPGTSYVSSWRYTSGTHFLRDIAEKVVFLNIGTTQTPKHLWYVSPDEKEALSAITARISELYKVTDEQIANAPPFTRAICWLTSNSLFPEYQLRQRLENYVRSGDEGCVEKF